MTQPRAKEKFREGRGQRCDGCTGDLTCCVAMNGCEPWLTKVPSAHISLDTRTQKRTWTQVIHEQGRTWVAVTVYHWTRAPRLGGGRTYWTFEFAGVLEELPAYELHAPGVCERCTRRWRGLEELEAAA